MTKFPVHSSLLWAAVLLLLLAGCGGPEFETTPTAAAGVGEFVRATAAGTADDAYPLAETDGTQSYPAPNGDELAAPSPEANPYPAAGSERAETNPLNGTPAAEVFLPITSDSSPAAANAGETKEASPANSPTPVPTIDFAAMRDSLRNNGRDLGYVKIGFHVTLPEDRDLLDPWMQQLDQAGVPFFLKAVDNAEPVFRAQELMKVSGVPHTLVYRSTGGEPLYDLPAEQAAQINWQDHRDRFPPELDPSLVWIETLNEPDRTQAEWFGRFAQEVARLAMADGFKWAAFGWASGEPEPEQWQTPSMLAFLQMAGENPERLAIALHEYSFLKENLAHEYPFKVGRFQELFRIADVQGFPRPTILITEWGWEHNNIPDPDQAMRDIAWASELYAPYPEVKGAAVWNLGIGCCFGDISEQVQQIIEPLTRYSLTHYFEIPQSPEKQAINPEQFRP